jgi:hypothetical protein
MGAGLWPPRASLGARGRLCAGLCHWRWLGRHLGGMVVVMTKDEALRLALEALEDLGNHDRICPQWPTYAEPENYPKCNCGYDQAITAIKAALEAKDEPVAHSVVAGALFDFMGWLTSREKRLILSSVDEASPAVEAITEFAKKRNLSLKNAEVGYWMEFLSTPPQRTWVGLTDEHKEGLIYMTDPNPEPHHLRELIDVVEFQLKEKNT